MKKLILKEEHYNKHLVKSGVAEFNTIDITEETIPYYVSIGFGYLFEEVKPKKK